MRKHILLYIRIHISIAEKEVLYNVFTYKCIFLCKITISSMKYADLIQSIINNN